MTHCLQTRAPRYTPGPHYGAFGNEGLGLDLSGSLQGAGGIGGLLAAQLYNPTTSNSTTVLYTYRANGNVSELVDATGTNILAHYEYSPFGEAIVATGPLAEVNAIRFSTKYWDLETGLGYWGMRYYHPDEGRWVRRDPIGEGGGIGLYVFVENRPSNLTDLLGQSWWNPFSWGRKPCCNGKPYNSGDFCCCDKGKVVTSGGSGCDLLAKKEVATGVKSCVEALGLGRDRGGIVQHAWLEIGTTFKPGFRPEGNCLRSGGKIQPIDDATKPDPITGNPKKKLCHEIKLSPCDHNIEEFVDALVGLITQDMATPPVFNFALFNCQSWVERVLGRAEKASKGCGVRSYRY